MAQEFSVDVSNFKRLLKHLSVDQLLAAEQELQRTAIDIQGKSAKKLSDNGTNATSNLANSGRVKRLKKYWTVGYYAKYASVVEFGRKAGTGVSPDGIKKLEAWVRRKLRIKNKRQTKRMKERGIKPKDEVRSVAFAIANKIRERGTKPQPFLYPAYRECSKGLSKRILKIITDTKA